jgi:hypothetical protein
MRFGCSVEVTHNKIFVGAYDFDANNANSRWRDVGVVEQLDLNGNHELSIIPPKLSSTNYGNVRFGYTMTAGEDALFISQGANNYWDTCWKVNLPITPTPYANLHTEAQALEDRNGANIAVLTQTYTYRTSFYPVEYHGMTVWEQPQGPSGVKATLWGEDPLHDQYASRINKISVGSGRTVFCSNMESMSDSSNVPTNFGHFLIGTTTGDLVRRVDPLRYRIADANTDVIHSIVGYSAPSTDGSDTVSARTYGPFGNTTVIDGEHIFANWYNLDPGEYPDFGVSNAYANNEGLILTYDLNGNFKDYVYSPNHGNTSIDTIWFGYSVGAGEGVLAVSEYILTDSEYNVHLYNSQSLDYIKTLHDWGSYNVNNIVIGQGRILIASENYVTSSGAWGRVFVYNNEGTLLDTIDNPNSNTATSGSSFGGGFADASMSIGNGRIVIGNVGDEESSDDGATDAGAVYIYETPDQVSIWDTNVKMLGRLIS